MAGGVQSMQELAKEAAKGSRMYAWRHCNKCGWNYPVSQLVCTNCARLNADTSKPTNWLETDFAKSLVLKTGTVQPSLERRNIDYPLPEGLRPYGDCTSCAKSLYCSHFGKIRVNKVTGAWEEYFCPKSDEETCACRECCNKAKRYYAGEIAHEDANKIIREINRKMGSKKLEE